MTKSNSASLIRSDDVTSAALYDGFVSGGLTLIPSTAAVYAAMQRPAFRKATNWQSRTAIAIMPPLFMFALASEMKLNHKMKEYKSVNDHSKKISQWAEDQNQYSGNGTGTGSSTVERGSGVQLSSSSTIRREFTNNKGGLEKNLHALYKKSVEESGVRIVPGDSLGVHHKLANFWQENPFKILAAFSVPTVLYIFRGNNEKKHLQLQSKIMHTRVYGQFMVIGMLLSFMGFKNYMDSAGKFITQQEADYRVEDMKRMREDLLRRIEFDKKMKARREKILQKTQSEVEGESEMEGLSVGEDSDKNDSTMLESAREKKLYAKKLEVISIEDA